MNPVERMPAIQVGETVTYRWEVLRNRGWYTRDFLRARGQVTGLEPMSQTVLVRVAWNRPGLPTLLNPQELCRIAAPSQAVA